MKEFIEKLIGRLEEQKSDLTTWAEDKAFEIGIQTAISIVNQLAEEYRLFGNPEQSNNGWIACSERLPIGEEYHKRIDGVDYYKHMLTFANDIDAPICVGWYDQEDENWYDIEGFVYYPKAWQPLPDQYIPNKE